MNVLTHFFVGWTLAEASNLAPRDRAIVTWAGVVPDLDGLAVVPDLANRLLGRPETDFYFRHHHVWMHGLPAALLTASVAALMGARKKWVALLAFLSFHLHLLLDLVGSRGPTKADIWAIGYLEPFSERLTFAWQSQWALNDWRNVLLTVVLLSLALARAVRRGYSPVSLFSRRADAAVVATLRARFGPKRWRGGK